ncbi:hypothetical protein L596_001095 [Steinernema carpocapsae]|uniref:Uncharacterized protein n=1 Tax=Steinernema carpocapsae TaxID=34508 RepID=A0A4U8UML6_STECR|nr:hypothetical protein L596_001095 [Steinernema carpocapsae]
MNAIPVEFFEHIISNMDNTVFLDQAATLEGRFGACAQKYMEAGYYQYLHILDGQFESSHALRRDFSKIDREMSLCDKYQLEHIVDYGTTENAIPEFTKQISNILKSIRGRMVLDVRSPLMNSKWTEMFSELSALVTVNFRVHFTSEISDLVHRLLERRQIQRFYLTLNNYEKQEIGLMCQFMLQKQFRFFAMDHITAEFYQKLREMWIENAAAMAGKRVFQKGYTKLHDDNTEIELFEQQKVFFYGERQEKRGLLLAYLLHNTDKEENGLEELLRSATHETHLVFA